MKIGFKGKRICDMVILFSAMNMVGIMLAMYSNGSDIYGALALFVEMIDIMVIVGMVL